MKSHKFANAYKTHTHKLFFLGQQLDYVFYKNLTLKNIEVKDVKFSDHFPISAEFNLF